jgi:transcriptional regulator with XRE-family HTH domain
MTKIRELLASNIRKYRHARGWSQAKLAEKVGTSAHYIGMLETQTKYPSPEMLERIAAALDIDTTDLFRKDIDPGETVKSLRKAILIDVGGVMGNFIGAQIRDLEGEDTCRAKFSPVPPSANTPPRP